jgi:photoactive yellow protein
MDPVISICAWCGREKSVEAGGAGSVVPRRVSHGICPACAAEFGGAPVEDLSAMGAEEAEALPWGAFRLDDAGTVRVYNRVEGRLSRRDPDSVVGRDFFREVAPCTAVEGFRGRFVRLQALPREARDSFEFLFRFAHGPIRVRIVLVRDPLSASTTVLVHPLDSIHGGAAPHA